MILRGQLRGKVGRRRDKFYEKPLQMQRLFAFYAQAVRPFILRCTLTSGLSEVVRHFTRIAGFTLLLATTLTIAGLAVVYDTPVRALVSWCLAVAIFVIVIALVPTKLMRCLLALAGGIYCAACLGLTILIFNPGGLDADFVLASPTSSAKTLLKTVGGVTTSLFAAIVAFVIFLYVLGLFVLARRIRARRSAIAALAMSIVGIALSGAPHRLLLPSETGREHIHPLMPAPHPPLVIRRGENVFIVQLESINGLMSNGDYRVDGRPVIDPMPAVHQLARRGVYFPRFWGNDVVTHRAQQTILCGAVRNVDRRYFDEVVPWPGDCLPALFRKAGYKTVFLSSFDDGRYVDTDKFMARAGFDDRHFADFMKAEDRKARWGYDESTTFTRAFEYLRSHYKPDDRLFVYIAVCAHHFGFERGPLGYLDYFQTDQKTRIMNYLVSQRVQDESLLLFDRTLREYDGGNSHLLIVPDHSFPLGLYGGVTPNSGATIDNFLTYFLYLPPTKRASQFAVGRTVTAKYGQSDLYATVIELMTDEPMQNSLVPVFKGQTPPGYEQCHVMTQPYAAPSVLIERGERLYQYFIPKRVLREFRLVYGPMRQELVREVPMTYEEYDRLYGCRRYR